MEMGGGSLSGNAITGLGAGVGGQVAADAVPDQYKPLANLGGQMLGGGAAALGTAGARAAYDTGASLAGRFAKPMMTRLPFVGQGVTKILPGNASPMPLPMSGQSKARLDEAPPLRWCPALSRRLLKLRAIKDCSDWSVHKRHGTLRRSLPGVPIRTRHKSRPWRALRLLVQIQQRSAIMSLGCAMLRTPIRWASSSKPTGCGEQGSKPRRQSRTQRIRRYPPR